MGTSVSPCLMGLVSISGSCGIIEPHFAIVVGIVAGMLYARQGPDSSRACCFGCFGSLLWR